MLKKLSLFLAITTSAESEEFNPETSYLPRRPHSSKISTNQENHNELFRPPPPPLPSSSHQNQNNPIKNPINHHEYGEILPGSYSTLLDSYAKYQNYDRN